MRLLHQLLLIFGLFASSALADSGPFFQTESIARNLYENFEEKALNSPDWNIHQHFKIAMSQMKQENYANLAETIEELKFVAGSRGYTDLPDYSLEFIRYAAVEKDRFKSKFLIEKALYLSPTNSKVAYAAASFHETLGFTKSFSLVFSNLFRVFTQPLFLSSIILNLSIVILVAFTISVFLAFFIQMLRNSNNIREIIVPFMPWKFRGLLSVLVMFLIYTLPFFGGILMVLSVWGMCLALAIDKKYLFIAGILCLSWGWALPKISVVAYNLNDPSSKVFEDLNLSRFSPKAEQYLQERLAIAPNDGTAIFFLAQTFRLKGFSDAAKDLFEKASNIPGADSELRKVSQANLGVVAFDNGEYEEALELLKQAENSSIKGFELYYNLAITNLLMLDTDEYNRYYNIAKDIDPERISQIVSEKYISPKAILIPISSSAMIKPLFRPIVSTDKIELKTIEDKYERVVMALSGKLQLNLVMALGVLMIVAAYSIKQKKKNVFSTSKAWLFFPLGRYVTSNQIIFSVIGLTILFSLLLLSPNGILNLYGNLISYQSIYNEFLYLALLMLLIVQFLSYYTIQDESDA